MEKQHSYCIDVDRVAFRALEVIVEILVYVAQLLIDFAEKSVLVDRSACA